MVEIYKVALIKVRRIKHNFQQWFDGEITEVITNHDQLSRKFKKSRLNIDKKLYNVARYKKSLFFKKIK